MIFNFDRISEAGEFVAQALRGAITELEIVVVASTPRQRNNVVNKICDIIPELIDDVTHDVNGCYIKKGYAKISFPVLKSCRGLITDWLVIVDGNSIPIEDYQDIMKTTQIKKYTSIIIHPKPHVIETGD